MNKKEVKEFLKSKPGYLKEPAQRLSDKLECSLDVCKIALKEARIDARAAEDFDLDNVTCKYIR